MQLVVSLVLYNCELRQELKTETHFWMGIVSDEETSFSIDKPHNPISLQLSRSRLNVKSLRVLHRLEPSLRIVPMSVGF